MTHFPYLVWVIWVCKDLDWSPLLPEELVGRDGEQFIVLVKELSLQKEMGKEEEALFSRRSFKRPGPD